MKAKEYVNLRVLFGYIRTERSYAEALDKCEAPYLLPDKIVGW